MCSFFLIATANCSNCPFYYHKQPPIHPDCNVLNSSNFSLHCQVCASINLAICNIGWYKNDSQPVNSPSSNTDITNIVMIRSNIRGNRLECIESWLRFGTLNSDLYGSYYCQIETCSYIGTVHPSNRIHLISTVSPTSNICINNVISIENRSCALSTCSLMESITPSFTQPLIKNRQVPEISPSSTASLVLNDDLVQVAVTSVVATLALLIVVIIMFMLVGLFGWLGYRKFLLSMY